MPESNRQESVDLQDKKHRPEIGFGKAHPELPEARGDIRFSAPSLPLFELYCGRA